MGCGPVSGSEFIPLDVGAVFEGWARHFNSHEKTLSLPKSHPMFREEEGEDSGFKELGKAPYCDFPLDSSLSCLHPGTDSVFSAAFP